MKKLLSCFAMVLLGSIFAAALPAHADESLFGYLYITDSLPKDKWEFEQWSTLRAGKARGNYDAIDFSDELEYGITDRFTGSLYVNSFYLNTKNVYDPDDSTSTLSNQSIFDFKGMSMEFRYRILSPYTDGFGFSVYAEPEIQLRDPLSGSFAEEKAVEFRLIAEKHFLEDSLVFAGNIMAEPEFKHNADGTSGRELHLEGDLGLSYRFATHWAAGLELRNHREFNNMDLGKQAHFATYLGPNLHYGTAGWWATLTVLPQLSGFPTDLGPDASGSDINGAPRQLSEYEKLQIRLKVGIEL